jgi:nucleoside-diphosphate-sugar epimerase
VGVGQRSVENVVGSARPNRLADDLNHVLAHTKGLWDDLRGQRLFITGGTGFFGCWLLESFLWANDSLDLNASAVVLTRDGDAFRRKAPHLANHSAVALHGGDIRTFEFPDGTFSHVIHAATESSTTLNRDDPLAMFDSIVSGTQRTLEFARRDGATRYLLTSSGAVYGRQPADVRHVPEDFTGAPDPADPRSAYGEGKRAAETLCAAYARQHGVHATIARCFAFVGPYLPLDAHFAIGNFIRDAITGGPIRITGDGTPFRSYLYASDLAIWLWTILLKGESMRPYNVGSASELTIEELADVVARSFTPPRRVAVAHRPVGGTLANRYVPAVNRAEAELGLRRIVSLPDAIARTIGWHTGTETRPRLAHS